MPGRKCPKCGQATFFVNARTGECKSCGYKMQIPPNEGKGGKGKKCTNCGRFTVFNDICSNCGARYKATLK